MSSFTYSGQYNTSTGLFAADTTGTGGSTPIGSIIMFGSATAPANFLVCDGASYSKGGIYTQLYSVIGDTFGTDGAKFRVPDLTGKFPAGRSGSLGDRVMETGAIGSFGDGTLNGLATLPLASTPDHHHTFAGSGTATMTPHDHAKGTLIYTQVGHEHSTGTLSYIQVGHEHATGTLAFTGVAHQHAFGTINYIQDQHYHNMTHLHTLSAHTHSAGTLETEGGSHEHGVGTLDYARAPHNHLITAHHHDLNTQSGSSNNWAFPLKYNNIGSSIYKGFYWGYGDDAAAAGATAAYYPQNLLPQDNAGTTNTGLTLPSGTMTGDTAAGGVVTGSVTGDTGVPSADTTGASSFSYTGNKTPTGTVSGDTATATGTGTMSGDVGTTTATGNLTGDVGTTTATGSLSGDTAEATTTGTLVVTGDVTSRIDLVDAAVTQVKYAPPFLSLTFIIRFQET